ncbi:hypothetical protein HFO55_09765 [Rhizobium leguminosarum]|uniref:hypothetical protein n=1 Tax=Rhizobium leguminosarum TaxID=384 RepID=UPI001C951B92|nr:hypothetical protein [Rhizobium leguminosarum]MBY5567536.1 hypothetical protein [Rhizobium leguminosarum]MBY5572430.1 hypothetical protein [Rhizobium leguminosarum]
MIILYESAKAVGIASPGRKPGTCFKHIAVLLNPLSKLLVELGLRPGVPADLSFQNRFLRRPAAAGG